MERFRTHLVIVGFALLHHGTAILCRTIGIPDEMVLTLLTMLMIAIVCQDRRMSVEFTAVAIVLGNLLGYAIGYILQASFGLVFTRTSFSAASATFATTIVIGYATYLTSFIGADIGRNQSKGQFMIWSISAITLVFFTRLLIALFAGNNDNADPFGKYFLASGLALMIVLFLFLGSFVIYEKRKSTKEREKRHLAQFQYMKLSQQLNPHFLFNSLNILDSLVQEDKNELASTYIHKLAALYRYLLKNEDATTTKIKDEIEFVDKYIDLLKIRFTDGLQVETRVSPSALGKSVVPSSIQLLIENATKHNAALPDNPLRIQIVVDDNLITVTNTVCPKQSPVVSTGLGLKYIRQQYEDICGKSIRITHDSDKYTVELPVI